MSSPKEPSHSPQVTELADELLDHVEELLKHVDKLLNTEGENILPYLEASGLDPKVDLAGCNLSGANFKGVDLSDANFEAVDLSDADLAGVDLRGANLENASLQSADLSEVDFVGANLRGANLEDSDCRLTNFVNCTLDSTIMRNANIDRASFDIAGLQLALATEPIYSSLSVKEGVHTLIFAATAQTHEPPTESHAIGKLGIATYFNTNIDGKVAIYNQIQNDIQIAVSAGKLAAGDRLPKARELSRKLDVSPKTVARAYRDLINMGLIETQAGKGIVVASGAEERCRENSMLVVTKRIDDALLQAKCAGIAKEEIENVFSKSLGSVKVTNLSPTVKIIVGKDWET